MINLEKKFRRFLPLTFDRITPLHETEISHYVGLPDGFYGKNPGMVSVADGYVVCIRAVNYVYKNDNVHHRVLTTGDRFRTVNRFAKLDHAFQLRHTLPALDNCFDDIEDIKLFNFNGHIMGVGSFVDPAHGGDIISIALLTIDPQTGHGSYKLVQSPFKLPREKNWAPFVHDGALHFIYSFDPLIILRCDTEGGSVSFADARSASYTGDDLRFLVGGSSAGLPVPGGFLFAAHRRRVGLPRLRFNYVSRLCFLETAQMSLTLGRFFSIGPATIQFVNGLARAEDNFVFSYGQVDKSARMCRVPVAQLALSPS